MATQPPPYSPGVPFGYDPKQQRRFVKEQERAQRAAFKAQREHFRQQTRALRRGSILGPLIIVALGVAVLLVRSGKVPFPVFASWYGHWWPLLLVGAGAVMLIEWSIDQMGQREGVPPVRRGLGAGVVVLVLLVALTGAMSSGFHDGHEFVMHGININGDNLEEFFGEKHESEQVVDQAFAPGTTLSVENPRGDVTITGKSDDGRIHVTVNKQVYSRSDNDAQSEADSLNPEMTMAGNVMNLRVPGLEGASTDLSISLPEGATTVVNANRGVVLVSSMRAPVTVTSNRGDVEVKSIAGPVEAHVNSRNSSFTAHDVTGSVSLRGHVQDVNVSDVGGVVSLEGDFYGETHLEHLKGPLTFQTSLTHFTLARLDGEIDIDRSNLSGNQIVGPTALRGRSRNISFERVTGDIDVTNSNGSVEIKSASPLGNLTIENSNGAVDLVVPPASGLTVEAETRGGDVGDDLSLTTTKVNDRTRLEGRVGDGTSKIRVHTSHADIQIHQGMVLPPVPPSPPMPMPIIVAPTVPAMVGLPAVPTTPVVKAAAKPKKVAKPAAPPAVEAPAVPPTPPQ